MTSFAQLDHGEGLEKAAVGGLVRGLHTLVRDGLWKTLGRTAKPSHTGLRALGNKASRAFYNPATNKSTGLGKLGMGYGFAGMVSPLAGINLPGSNLAFMAASPGYGTLFSAPNVIKSLRANNDHNRQRMQDDARIGAQMAGADLLGWSQANPHIATKRDLFSQYARQINPQIGSQMDYYRGGQYKDPGKLKQLGWFFNDSDQLVRDRLDKNILGFMNKSGGMRKSAAPILGRFLAGAGKGLKWGAGGGATLGAGGAMFDSENDTFGSAIKKTLRGAALGAGVGSGAGGILKAFGGTKNVLPWLGVGAGAYGVGKASLSDKPYNESDAISRGYVAAQMKMQDKLNNMGGFQRFMVGMDPSLIAPHLEKALPGTMGMMQNTYGPVRPGFLGRMMGVSQNSKNPDAGVNYVTYDANGGSHYL